MIQRHDDHHNAPEDVDGFDPVFCSWYFLGQLSCAMNLNVTTKNEYTLGVGSPTSWCPQSCALRMIQLLAILLKAKLCLHTNVTRYRVMLNGSTIQQFNYFKAFRIPSWTSGPIILYPARFGCTPSSEYFLSRPLWPSCMFDQ